MWLQLQSHPKANSYKVGFNLTHFILTPVKILFLNVVKKANVATIAIAFGLWMVKYPPCCRRNGDGRDHVLTLPKA